MGLGSTSLKLDGYIRVQTPNLRSAANEWRVSRNAEEMSGAYECGRRTDGQEEKRREEERRGREKKIIRPQVKLRSAQRAERTTGDLGGRYTQKVLLGEGVLERLRKEQGERLKKVLRGQVR